MSRLLLSQWPPGALKFNDKKRLNATGCKLFQDHHCWSARTRSNWQRWGCRGFGHGNFWIVLHGPSCLREAPLEVFTCYITRSRSISFARHERVECRALLIAQVVLSLPIISVVRAFWTFEGFNHRVLCCLHTLCLSSSFVARRLSVSGEYSAARASKYLRYILQFSPRWPLCHIVDSCVLHCLFCHSTDNSEASSSFDIFQITSQVFLLV